MLQIIFRQEGEHLQPRNCSAFMVPLGSHSCDKILSSR